MALLRSPRRRDISIPALRVVAGLVAQIVLGGIVVLTKLNPYPVAFHFVLTLAVLAIAISSTTVPECPTRLLQRT